MFFLTALDTGPRRPLHLESSDTHVYVPRPPANNREAPGMDKLRPDQSTPIPNFFLSGADTYQVRQTCRQSCQTDQSCQTGQLRGSPIGRLHLPGVPPPSHPPPLASGGGTTQMGRGQLKDIRTENGSIQGQNMALTGLFVPSSLDSGQSTPLPNSFLSGAYTYHTLVVRICEDMRLGHAVRCDADSRLFTFVLPGLPGFDGGGDQVRAEHGQ